MIMLLFWSSVCFINIENHILTLKPQEKQTVLEITSRQVVFITVVPYILLLIKPQCGETAGMI